MDEKTIINLEKTLLGLLRVRWPLIDGHIVIVHAGTWSVLHLYHTLQMTDSGYSHMTAEVKRQLSNIGIWSGSVICAEDESCDPKRIIGGSHYHYIYWLSPLPQDEVAEAFQTSFSKRCLIATNNGKEF